MTQTRHYGIARAEPARARAERVRTLARRIAAERVADRPDQSPDRLGTLSRLRRVVRIGAEGMACACAAIFAKLSSGLFAFVARSAYIALFYYAFQSQSGLAFIAALILWLIETIARTLASDLDDSLLCLWQGKATREEARANAAEARVTAMLSSAQPVAGGPLDSPILETTNAALIRDAARIALNNAAEALTVQTDTRRTLGKVARRLSL